ncbi:MAG: pyridoxal-phosphate dependent enzyme [Deltaproteobacteria bacterium]|nr:pyridoxal-phosphate dependent enzyme [Deltaproteobacteria bacterium]
MDAIARHLPRLAARVPWVRLGDWPTPLEPIELDGRTLWVKHEGASHTAYGGNKIRTLEVWLGHARAEGAKRIWAIGAYGSNHAIATIVHAPRAGLDAGAIVFPQPSSAWAVENCGALIATGCPILRLRNVVEVPFAAAWVARRERGAIVMPPGGATPVGTFGAASAAFELAEQIAAGRAPPPRRIVVPIGSTCTTAGLLAGLALAHATGAWRWPVPIVHGVRVTPWPITSRLRIANLAAQTLARVEQLGGPRVAIGVPELYARLVVDGRELGPGYGRPTDRALAAMARFADAAAPPRLDVVYSGKAAAALLRLHRAKVGPLVFWASKSTTVLSPPSPAALAAAPSALRTWLRDG